MRRIRRPTLRVGGLALVVILLATSRLDLSAQKLLAQTEIPQTEYDALVALHDSTDGPNWSCQWTLPTNEPCSLKGVHCWKGQVTRLWLDRCGLSGPLPAELADLAFLRDLRVGHNKLTGALLPSLGDLQNLQNVTLHDDQLTGTIPPKLGSLPSLETLWLDDNQLSGSVPPDMASTTTLTTLRLSATNLSGGLPMQLMELTRLYEFWYDCTLLCEPQNAPFQAWLSRIDALIGTGISCADPVFVPVVVR